MAGYGLFGFLKYWAKNSILILSVIRTLMLGWCLNHLMVRTILKHDHPVTHITYRDDFHLTSVIGRLVLGWILSWVVRTLCIVLGLRNLDQAEEYLLQAQWTVLKTPECPNTIRHKLSRHLGLLYTAKSQYSHALRQLAYDVCTTVFYLYFHLYDIMIWMMHDLHWKTGRQAARLI